MIRGELHARIGRAKVAGRSRRNEEGRGNGKKPLEGRRHIGAQTRVAEASAREADVVSVNVNLKDGLEGSAVNASAAATAEKVGWIREAAGTRTDALELHIFIHVVKVISDHRDAATASASSRSSATACTATGPSAISVLAGTSSRPGTSVPGLISCMAARTIVGAER